MGSMFEKPKVHSLKSHIIVSRDKFPDLLKQLKSRSYHNAELKKAISAHQALKVYGWSARMNTNGMIGLSYQSDNWKIEHSFALTIVARFAEPGGYIHMVDEDRSYQWVYKFNDGILTSNFLSKRYIDFRSEEELLTILDEVLSGLFNLGIGKTEINKRTQKVFISKIINIE